MIHATLKNIKLQNFKGIAQSEKTFNADVEKIMASNGSGKSTYMYGFQWTLGLAAPDVIPAINNSELDLVTRVEVAIVIDDLDYVFAREQKPTTKVNKETGERIKTGNESTYIIDGNEFTLTKFKEKVSTIFGNSYEYIPMLVNKEYFNNNLKWQDARKILFDISKVDDVLKTLAEKDEYSLISVDLRKGYSTSELKKTYRKERTGLKDLQDKNDTIIATRNADLAKYSDIDFDSLQSEKLKLTEKLARAQTATRREQKDEVITDKVQQKSDLVTKLSKLQSAGLEEKAAMQSSLTAKNRELENIKREGQSLKMEIDTAYITIKTAERKLKESKSMEHKGETSCAACGQALPEEKVSTAHKLFEDEKNRLIKFYTNEIKAQNKVIAELEPKREELQQVYKTKASEYNYGVEQLNNYNPNADLINDIKAEIIVLNGEIDNLKLKTVKVETADKIAEINAQIDEINGKLAYQRVITDTRANITAKKQEQKEIADKIALVERKEAQVERFVAEQVSLVNSTINSKFGNGVQFALYNELYRGGDGGLEETCVCMLNGRRYTSLSTGEKYFADLEVIKSLQAEYGVNLPVFCDNAESFTGEYSADQQIVELHAVKGKKLENTVYVDMLADIDNTI